MSHRNSEPADRVMDAGYFRRVLGNYPTGVTAITARADDGQPIGMVVGTFSSVSLDPPLVSFMPAKTSSSFAAMRDASTFCVNVLSRDQEPVCRAFAVKGATDKFAGVRWHPAAGGAPIIDDAVAWIECQVESVIDAGDHEIVIGRVLDLAVTRDDPALPLLFFQGGYGRFSPHSRVLPAAPDTLDLLRLVDRARSQMESLAAAAGAECAAIGHIESWIVGLASAGAPSTGQSPNRVGVRLPFEAPMAPLFVAWEDEAARRRWLREAVAQRGDDFAQAHLAALDRVRQRGWTVSLYSPELRELDHHLYRYADGDMAAWEDLRVIESRLDGPGVYELDEIDPSAQYAVRNIAAPVFGEDGRVGLYLSLRGLPALVSGAQLDSMIERLTAAATAASAVRA